MCTNFILRVHRENLTFYRSDSDLDTSNGQGDYGVDEYAPQIITGHVRCRCKTDTHFFEFLLFKFSVLICLLCRLDNSRSARGRVQGT